MTLTVGSTTYDASSTLKNFPTHKSEMNSNTEIIHQKHRSGHGSIIGIDLLYM
jgi:hypothetical protein